MSKLAQQGFLTIAQNTDVDYLRLAYVQAMSVKITMPGAKYAVVVDGTTEKQITDKHRRVFDYIVPLAIDDAKNDKWKLANEWQVCRISPFKETIKLESDIVFTRSIDHWWTAMRLKNVVLSLGCKDYQGKKSTSRKYRRVFDDNNLPDVYNGLMYFRYSEQAYKFFEVARQCFQHWQSIVPQLKNYRDEQPTTDLVYAIVAKHLGIETCTLPSCDFINFTHMKNSINNWPEGGPWHELVITELDLPMVRVNNVNQYYPFHYQDKTWITDDLIERYESCLQI